MKKILFSLSLVFSFLIGIAQENYSTNVERQVIVVPNERMEDMTTSFIEVNNAKIVKYFEHLNWYLVELPETTNQDSFIKLCKDFSFIKTVYKDEVMVYERDLIPNDPQFTSQWFLRQVSDKDINADLAWDSIPSNNIPTKVAVFDGGIDITHEDLVGNIVTPFNAVTNSFSNGELVDPINDRHGTACSGTIAAVTNNGIGVSSVGNNKVKVMPINIMTSITASGSFGTSTSIQVNAINAAINEGCVAISMSYGGGSFSQALNDAFIIAKTQSRNGKGLFICASTGNNGSGNIIKYPASYSAVYGIGATSSSDLRASFSNFGTIVDISAPGAQILTTDLTGSLGYNTGNYASVSGTSFSCPITAAAGALILYKNPDLTESQVMNILASTANKVGGYVYSFDSSYPFSTRSNELGYGRINLFEAIKLTPLVGNPVIDPPSPEHDIVLFGCSVNNSAPALGTSITITTNQKTTAPTLSQINPKVQYRISNDNTWSADDIVIGVDTSYVGGGIESEMETINYTIPSNSTTGTKFILIRANFDNSVIETSNVNNTCSVPISVFNPASGGLDLSVTWTRDNLVTPNNTTGSGTIVRFRNTGNVPITSFSYRWKWENCPIPGAPTWYNCNSIVSTNVTPIYLGSTLMPGQNSGTFTSNICIGTCGTSSNPFTVIPLNETRNLIVEITSVNGLPTDDFVGNNIDILPITRSTASASNSDVIIEGEEPIEIPDYTIEYFEPIIKIYTITGALLDITDTEYLSHGIYIIQYIFPDRIVSEKIFK